MIREFNYYLLIQSAKKKSVDLSEAKSLLKQATARLKFVKSHVVNDNNCNFLFEDTYESIREASQSLMSLKGFKPYSHEAVISFLKEYYSSQFNKELINKFNHYRVMRNNITYRAKKVNKEETIEAINFAKKLIRVLKELYEKETSK